MSNSLFQQAARIVDAAIRKSGEIITCEERNKRVMAAEYNLRRGTVPDQIDTRSTLSLLSVAGLLKGSLKSRPVAERESPERAENPVRRETHDSNTQPA